MALLPAVVAAQETTTQKVLQMSVVRTIGTTTKAYLTSDETCLGPIINMNTDTLSLVNTSGNLTRIAMKRIKEIRFTIETIEIPSAIEAVSVADEPQAGKRRIFNLSGREYATEKDLPRGIYIIGNKKYVKR